MILCKIYYIIKLLNADLTISERKVLKMSKRTSRLIVLILTVSMLLPLLSVTSTAEELLAISDTSPAIAATVGDKIKLADYTISGVKCSDITWTGVGDGAVLEGGTFSAEEKGVYRFDGVKGSVNYTFFIVVKNTDEEEYILYENTFDDADSIADFKTVTGTKPVVEDGKLKVTGSTRVLLPEYIGFFGDYKIETIAQMTQANEGTRWMSVMFRVQKDNYPYYQMAIRQNATAVNGVEFAECTPEGQWSVPSKVPYKEALDPTKQYIFTIDAFGGVVQESINGNLLITAKNATSYKKGRVGFQVSSSTMLVDSIKITLKLGTPPKPYFETVDVRNFESNLKTTPTVVSYINTKSDYDNVLIDSPATALYYVNAVGDITDKSGTKLASIDEMYKKNENKVIAGFIPADKAAVDILTAFFAEKQIDDVMLASSDKDLVKYAREKHKMLRGAIIVPEDNATTKEALMQIRGDINSSLSKIAILPYEMARKEIVSYLQERLITVWVTAPENETEAQATALILSGANGIIVTNRGQAEGCFTKFEQNSFTREIYIIGHRGVPSQAPENTIEGSVLAAKFGAQIIENDIYITKDNVIVVLHDGTLERTTNGTGNIENYTYDQLQEFVIDENASKYPNLKIPTLEDYFKEFKDKEILLFVEIKSGKPALITELAKLVNEYDFHDQMCVISFNASQLLALQKVLPGMSMGYLIGGITSSDPVASVRATLELTQLYNTTFNQSYTGMNEDFIIESNHRGITVWPWTYRDRSIFQQYYLYGTYGLTTDYAQWSSTMAKKVVSESYDYDLTVGESKEIVLKALNYNNQETNVAGKLGSGAELVMLWGDDLVTIDGTTFTAKAAGEAAFYVRYQTKLLKSDTDVGEDIYVYSPVIRLTMTDNVSEIVESDTSIDTSLKSGVQWYVYAIIGVAVVGIAGFAVSSITKKKK